MAVLDPTDPASMLDASTDPLMSGANPSPSMVNPNPSDPNAGNLTASGSNPDGTNPLLALYAPQGGVVTSDAAGSSRSPTSTSAPAPIDYTLHNGETIAQSNARIAAANAAASPSPST